MFQLNEMEFKNLKSQIVISRRPAEADNATGGGYRDCA
jgi:hypothetical protein